MKIGAAFPSKYLKASDVEGGKAFTIRDVTEEQVGRDPSDRKPVVWFQETEKGLVLNKTNAGTISKVCGSDDTDHWEGKAITLVDQEVEFQGERMMAIRVSLRAAARNDGATRPQPPKVAGVADEYQAVKRELWAKVVAKYPAASVPTQQAKLAEHVEVYFGKGCTTAQLSIDDMRRMIADDLTPHGVSEGPQFAADDIPF